MKHTKKRKALDPYPCWNCGGTTDAHHPRCSCKRPGTPLADKCDGCRKARAAIQYQAVLETQSYGHYSEFARCPHRHQSEDTAAACAEQWERRERRIRAEQGTLDNGSRFRVKEGA